MWPDADIHIIVGFKSSRNTSFWVKLDGWAGRFILEKNAWYTRTKGHISKPNYISWFMCCFALVLRVLFASMIVKFAFFFPSGSSWEVKSLVFSM